MTRLLAALAGAMVALLAGCGSMADPLPVSSPPAPAPVVATVAEPTSVRVPTIGVSSTLTRTGMDEATHVLEVPPVTQPAQASWFAGGGRPGEAGYPAIVLGHVSGRPPGASHSVPGVFARLAELGRGDGVFVDRADGTVARFVVDHVERYCKTESDVIAKRCEGPVFDEAAVYGDTPTPTLRLITCGGEYDAAERSYLKNIVVFAVLVP